MELGDRIGRRVKLHDIHVLMAVAQVGSMGKAAVLLNTTQSAISRSIADLEKTMGVQLLDRSPQGVVPTQYGRAVLKRGTVVFDELKQSVRDVEALADPGTGELSIGCSPGQMEGLVFAAIERLSRQYPRIAIQVSLGGIPALCEELQERRIEIGCCRLRTPAPSDNIAQEFLFNDPLVVVAGMTSRWVHRRKISLADLVDEPWTWVARGTGLDSIICNAFRAKGLEPPRTTVLGDSISMRVKLVASGRFLGVLPASTLRFHEKAGSMKKLPIELSSTDSQTGIVTLKNRTLSPLAQRFIETAREVAKPLTKGRS